jgi:hypothetical protein
MSNRRKPLERPVGRDHMPFGSWAAISMRYSLVFPKRSLAKPTPGNWQLRLSSEAPLKSERTSARGDLREAHFRLE